MKKDRKTYQALRMELSNGREDGILNETMPTRIGKICVSRVMEGKEEPKWRVFA